MATWWSKEDQRWFVDGKAVYAGAGMEMQGVVLEYDDEGEETRRPGKWFAVRVESRNAGQVLDAWMEHNGVQFSVESIAAFAGGEPYSTFPLRWPKGGDDG